MADAEKSTEKLVKLLAVQRDLVDKLTAVHEEMDAILAGKAGIGEILKRLEAHYDSVWAVRYAPGETGRYVWQYAKDRPHLKRLVKKLGVDELEIRMVNYLKNPDPYYTKARHPFGLFVASVNTHASEGRAEGELALEDDVAATKKRLAAIRGSTWGGHGI